MNYVWISEHYFCLLKTSAPKASTRITAHVGALGLDDAYKVVPNDLSTPLTK